MTTSAIDVPDPVAGQTEAADVGSFPSEEGLAEVRQRMRRLARRDLQLWLIVILMFGVVAMGFASLVFPRLLWANPVTWLEGKYLPQLFFGFVTLIVLLNAYVITQRRLLTATREELIRQVLAGDEHRQLSLIDPLTGLFNRRYMETVLPKEASRADRNGNALTLLMIDVDGLKAINSRLGHVGGDQFLREVAGVLKATFRNADTVVRYGGDEFLVIMPETDEQQAAAALVRLHANVARWNATAGRPARMSVSCGITPYFRGSDLRDVIETADGRMYAQKKMRHAALGSLEVTA